MPTLISNANTNGFLSNDFPHNPPRLYFTAETDDFDELTLQEWRDEGFNVEYVPLKDGGKEYGNRLERLSHVGLGVGETFAIVAYGDAATFCLEHYLRPANNKLCALVAYYPTAIPDTQIRFPSAIRVLVHLAGSEVGVTRTQQVLGLQGKRRTVTKRINPGMGTGGTLRIAYPAYTYDNAEPGFTEHDLDEYERVSAELAWSRTLDVIRRAFRRDADLEKAWEDSVQNRFFTRSVPGTLQALTKNRTPHVTYAPTLTGGVGEAELSRFYAEFFIQSNPGSMRMRLLSRTIGADRVVDELHVSFKHSQDMPWILPGVPATNKKVEVIVISIVCIRGGKLYHEHVYWDQASVLVQVGLLNPALVPKNMKCEGVDKLPVVGREAARRIAQDDGREANNELIPGWEEEEQSEDEVEEEEEESEEDPETDNATEAEDGRDTEDGTEAEEAKKAGNAKGKKNANEEKDSRVAKIEQAEDTEAEEN